MATASTEGLPQGREVPLVQGRSVQQREDMKDKALMNTEGGKKNEVYHLYQSDLTQVPSAPCRSPLSTTSTEKGTATLQLIRGTLLPTGFIFCFD